MRIESAPGQEDVRLCRHRPAQMARQQPAAIGEQVAAAAKIEAWPYEAAGGDGQPDCTHEEQRDRRPDQGPHTEAREGEDQCDSGRYDGGNHVHHRMPFEIERAHQQHFGNRDEGDGDEDQRLQAQQIRHHRLAVISGGHRSERELRGGNGGIDQNQHAEGLLHDSPVDLLALD